MSNTIMDLSSINEEMAIKAFSDDDGLKTVISEAKSIVDGFNHDLSTKSGRDKTASIAYKISKLKSRLDGLGKDLVAEWKTKAKAVDKNRKYMRDELDALRDEVRQPLTEWENKEAERVRKHKQVIDSIRPQSIPFHDMGCEELSEVILRVGNLNVDESFEEFEAEAHRTKAECLSVLGDAFAKQKEFMRQQQEIERLKKEAEEKAEAERIAAIRREAEAKARKEAEDNAREAQEKAERARIAVEERAKMEAERANQAERERIALEERIKIERQQEAIRAQQAEVLAKKQAEEAAEMARQIEVNIQAEKIKQEDLERERRESNKRHVGAVRKKAKECLMQQAGLSEADARRVVIAVSNNLIENVVINY